MENNTHENHEHNTTAIHDLFKLLSKKWALIIIYEMFHHEKMRFKEFESNLPQINSRTLTQRLKELEEAGFIHKDTSQASAKVIYYSLTAKSKDLYDTFIALGTWSQKWDIQ